MNKIAVAVVYGGRSVEHEVSIISALQAINALDKEKYQVIPLYISKKGAFYTGDVLLGLNNYRDINKLLSAAQPVYLSPNYGENKIFAVEKPGMFKKPFEQKIDVVLPVIHGTHGEDGCLQGLLELSGLPYAGPGVLGSACGMDKIFTKAILKEADIKVAAYQWFCYWQWQDNRQQIIAKIEAVLPYPLVVKPANLGSSIGISKAANQEQLIEAVELAGSFSDRIIVEEMISPLREINCAVLGSDRGMEFSFCEEPLTAADILSFGDKYLSSSNTKGMSGAKRRIPADISEQMASEIREIAGRTFIAMDCSGVCRIDFLINSENGQIYVNELNTIPGSLSFYLFEPAGKKFGQLLDDLIYTALQRYRIKEKKLYGFTSNILSQGGFKGKK